LSIIGIFPIQISKGFLQTLLFFKKNKPKSIILVNIEDQTVTLNEKGSLRNLKQF
jgi:hypothetical protein